MRVRIGMKRWIDRRLGREGGEWEREGRRERKEGGWRKGRVVGRSGRMFLRD